MEAVPEIRDTVDIAVSNGKQEIDGYYARVSLVCLASFNALVRLSRLTLSYSSLLCLTVRKHLYPLSGERVCRGGWSARRRKGGQGSGHEGGRERGKASPSLSCSRSYSSIQVSFFDLAEQPVKVLSLSAGRQTR